MTVMMPSKYPNPDSQNQWEKMFLRQLGIHWMMTFLFK